MTIFFKLWIALVLLNLFLPVYGRADVPRVKLIYSKIFDSVCAQQTNYQINSKWTAELNQRIPELQSSWDKNGTTLIEATQTIVGKPFSEHEHAVSLSVCSFPSMSNPLLINMRYSLASFTSDPMKTDITISIIFHELLHRFLGSKIPANSTLLKKYHAEEQTVLNHIHLFALQKAVYLKLNQKELLQMVIRKDQSLPNKSNARAWEVVNDKEDFNSFIKELKQ